MNAFVFSVMRAFRGNLPKPPEDKDRKRAKQKKPEAQQSDRDAPPEREPKSEQPPD